MAQYHRPERAGNVSEAEGGEGHDQRSLVIGAKENHREDEGSGGAKNEKVVVFDRASHKARDGRAYRGAFLRVVFGACPRRLFKILGW